MIRSNTKGKILIDIGHPGHVHLFKNFALIMQKKGHDVLFTCRNKEFERELLINYNFNFVSLGSKINNKYLKLFGLIYFNLKLLLVARKFKPTIFLSHGSPYAAQIAFLLRKKHISLEDTGNKEQMIFYLPFTYKILVAKSFKGKIGKKEVRYNGNHELFYLHPSVFVPEPTIYQKLGIEENTKYVLIRLIGWSATHDSQKEGDSLDFLHKLIDLIERNKMRVFISSEIEIPKFEEHRLNVSPELLHDVLKEAQLYVGQGSTTANEASMLGTFSVLINPQVKTIGICQELQKANLQLFFDNFSQAEKDIERLLQSKDLKEKTLDNLDKYLMDKPNPTDFLVDFIEQIL
jgi:predicted glycosyltransferase